MTSKRPGGRETWHRLLEWDREQADAERLAARLLATSGYVGVDPAHPLGGPDGGRDIVCKSNDIEWIVCVYFPRGAKEYTEVRGKFLSDVEKAKASKGEGVIFFANQELRLSERAEFESLAKPLPCDLYHLEKIALALDTPRNYGLRLEFLSIEMTKEEQISFFNERDQMLGEVYEYVKKENNRHSGMQTVFVQQHFDYLNPLSDSKLIECRNCGEVFRAERTPMWMHSCVLGELETVTCPSCGKVQAFR